MDHRVGRKGARRVRSRMRPISLGAPHRVGAQREGPDETQCARKGHRLRGGVRRRGQARTRTSDTGASRLPLSSSTDRARLRLQGHRRRRPPVLDGRDADAAPLRCGVADARAAADAGGAALRRHPAPARPAQHLALWDAAEAGQARGAVGANLRAQPERRPAPLRRGGGVQQLCHAQAPAAKAFQWRRSASNISDVRARALAKGVASVRGVSLRLPRVPRRPVALRAAGEAVDEHLSGEADDRAHAGPVLGQSRTHFDETLALPWRQPVSPDGAQLELAVEHGHRYEARLGRISTHDFTTARFFWAA
mmetsp:Transcript_4845/g.10526  ORF Transcript_4845/g.10526 Transcript_4845/m.10526 type:complete len:308 (-) Transcript_4845:1549-2472(-)